MKFLKFLLIGLFATSVAQAATITVTEGFGAQGITVTVANVAPTTFYWSVGNYNTGGSVYTQFGSAVADSAKINGSVTSTTPTSLNSQFVDLFVGTANSIAASGTSWVILRSTDGTTFPANVADATGVTLSATSYANFTIIASGSAGNTLTSSGLNFAAVPEPSVALLGALGGLALLRRRRN